uniref:Uncharacterized protein n=1 Tax=Romanomermis culicivorax TaxID=13658 RepID=A0A915L5G2_ROMCU
SCLYETAAQTKVESALSVYDDILREDVTSTGRNMTALETSISDQRSPLLHVIRSKTIMDATRKKVLNESKDYLEAKNSKSKTGSQGVSEPTYSYMDCVVLKQSSQYRIK